MYEGVRKLLTLGFLAHGVEINGIRVIQRSLNDNDWVLLQYRVNPKSPVSWKRWAVATSIWMIDGQIILGDEGALQRVYQMCASFPLNILEDLYAVLNALMRKVREASDVMEAFLYESEARYLWRSEGSRLVEDGRFGSQQTGLNAIQKLWLFFNRMEDDGDQERHDWDMAKFMIGPHVPKGIKKINAKDKQLRADLVRRREGIMDRTYYEVQGVLAKRKPEGSTRFDRFNGWEVAMAETPEELKDEMRRWVAGIKDPHDSIIDYVKSKIKTEKETARNQAKVQREALQRAMGEEGITKAQLIPMTGTAAQAFLERVKARMPGTSQVTQDLTHNSAYEKYIKNNPEVGVLGVDEHGNITTNTPVDPKEMLEMLRKPEEGQHSLQERIENRRPTMDYDDEGGDT